MQKLSGDAATALRPADCVSRLPILTANLQTKPQHTHTSISQNRETKVAHQDNCEDHCTPGIKLRKECVGNTCSPLTESAACRKIRVFLRRSVLWSWRRDSNPRPSDYKSDALPTELRQQFRGQLRLRANLSLCSLPNVRDNFKRYHNGNERCKQLSHQSNSDGISISRIRKRAPAPGREGV